jgi:hypothetical protein
VLLKGNVDPIIKVFRVKKKWPTLLDTKVYGRVKQLDQLQRVKPSCGHNIVGFSGADGNLPGRQVSVMVCTTEPDFDSIWSTRRVGRAG